MLCGVGKKQGGEPRGGGNAPTARLPGQAPSPEETGDPFDAAMGELGVRPAPEHVGRIGQAPPAVLRPRQAPRGAAPPKAERARRAEPELREPAVDPEIAEVLGRVRAASRGGSAAATPAGLGPRLDLHGLSVEHAVAEVRRFLALHARTAGAVRIVTGRGKHSGEAAIRDAVEELLGRSPQVVSLRRGEHGEGGDGALVVVLRKARE